MVYNDTTARQGLIQDMEDICGLGATGITSSTALFQQFTRWANKWSKLGATIAINAMDGWDFDDPTWTTYPSGTYTGTTSRDYVFDSSLKLLKIKKVAISYDGMNFANATPLDSTQIKYAKPDINADSQFSTSTPVYDPIGNAINIYPKFTAAQVSAGAKVYVEFLREPKEFATTGTDSQVSGIASPFEQIISKGASLDYCQIYKPALAEKLRLEIYGNGSTIPGILKEMKTWYNNRHTHTNRIMVADAGIEFK